MATRLKSLFQGQHSAFILKGAAFATVLGFATREGFRVIPFLLFMGVALIVYLTPLLHSAEYGVSFLALSGTSLLTLFSQQRGTISLLIIGIAGFPFYVLLGLKNVFFLHRERWHYVFHLVVFYGMFTLFFGANQHSFFLLKATLLVVVSFFLWREFFKMNSIYNRASQEISLAAGVTSFIMLQVLWATSLLPFGVLNAANFGVLATFTTGDLVARHVRGTLSRRVVLSSITIFVLFCLVIFGTSEWSI